MGVWTMKVCSIDCFTTGVGEMWWKEPGHSASSNHRDTEVLERI